MLIQALNYAARPLDIHRHLEAEHLDKVADRAAKAYALRRSEDRELDAAMTIGALRGAALGRRLSAPATCVTDAIFGAGLTLAPGFQGGVAPKLINAPVECCELLRGPVVQSVGRALGGAVLPAVGAMLGAPSLSAAEVKFLGEQMLSDATGALLWPVMIAVSVGTVASYWVSAGVKLAATAPLAAVGAAAGAALHRLHVASNEQESDLGFRGERNDLTFALMAPTSSVPNSFFFLSEDRFGLDVRELARFVEVRGSLINPHTNAPFSVHDTARLADILPAERGADAQVRLREPFQLGEKLWVKHFDALVTIAHQLGQYGVEGRDSRKRGHESLKALLQPQDPVEAVAVRLFIESILAQPWQVVLEHTFQNSSAAQHTAAVLLKMCINVGVAQIAHTPDVHSISGLFEHWDVVAGKAKRAQKLWFALRNPWFAKWTLTAEELGALRNP